LSSITLELLEYSEVGTALDIIAGLPTTLYWKVPNVKYLSAKWAYSTGMSLSSALCLSVTFRYRYHIGWNTSKVISRLNAPAHIDPINPNTGDRVQPEHPQN